MFDYKEVNGVPYFTNDNWETCKAGLKLDYAYISGSTITGGCTKEAETLRENIINELRKLNSDKPWSTNSINIEGAINIVKAAKY